MEEALLSRGTGPVAGIDEAGRGPWAGPVVAAAVILDPSDIPDGIDDSKALKPDAREAVCARIEACARVGVGIADVARIDRDNILAATMWAMAQALSQLGTAPAHALVDGNRLPRTTCPATAVVKGDAKCLSIAAASIVAKTRRDAIMARLALDHPGYGWETNMGYGTKTHQEGLARFGVTDHHRRSFAPVRALCAG